MMGSSLEINDTLKISIERGFPKELTLEANIKGTIPVCVSDNIFEFWNKGRRCYNTDESRVFLVQEIPPEGKWLHWGHALILEQTYDAVKKITRGKFRITKIYDVEYQRLATINEAPEGKSYFET